ncbi:MAG: hypothetical protein ABJF10_20225 [Chthoniobacter sp.]|uniref:hypothetical protein n=1 Tax=Chthoniobacter sp. TaxID=2510640 RepID=UPI0032ABE12A
MSKKPRGKDSDYLRFRPYHAFTSPPVDPGRNAAALLLWGAGLLVGAVALLVAGALWLSHR